MSRQRLTIAVPAAIQNGANLIWKIFDSNPAGDLTFTQAYSSTGSLPASHYLASGMYTPLEIYALSSAPIMWLVLNVFASVRGRTIPVTQAQFLTAWNSIQFSDADQDPSEFIIGLGLQPAS